MAHRQRSSGPENQTWATQQTQAPTVSKVSTAFVPTTSSSCLNAWRTTRHQAETDRADWLRIAP